MGDMVVNPSHYSWYKDKYGYDVMSILNTFSYTQANFIKYLLRAGKKKGNEVLDYDKAINLLNLPFRFDDIEDNHAYIYNNHPAYIKQFNSLVDAIGNVLQCEKVAEQLKENLWLHGYIKEKSLIRDLAMILEQQKNNWIMHNTKN